MSERDVPKRDWCPKCFTSTMSFRTKEGDMYCKVCHTRWEKKGV